MYLTVGLLFWITIIARSKNNTFLEFFSINTRRLLLSLLQFLNQAKRLSRETHTWRQTDKFKPPVEVENVRPSVSPRVFVSDVPKCLCSYVNYGRSPAAQLWHVSHVCWNHCSLLRLDIGVRLPNVKRVFPDVRLITLSRETGAKMQRRSLTDALAAFSCALFFFAFWLLHQCRVCRSAAENGRRGAKQTRDWKNKRNENVGPH